MPFNGSGVYQPVTSPDFPAVAGSTIRAAQYNNQINDMAMALTKCVTRDGQSPALANLSMGTYKHTDVGAAAARTDYARADDVQDGVPQYLTTIGGTPNAVTAVAVYGMSAYKAGQTFTFKAVSSNTGATTLSLNGIGARNIVMSDGAALAANAILAGELVTVQYDGTSFILAPKRAVGLGTAAQKNIGTSGNTVPTLDGKNIWSGQNTPKAGTLTDAATITWDADTNGQIVAVTLGGNRTMVAPTNIVQHNLYMMRVTQDGTGSRTLTWDAVFKFGTAGTPVLTTTAGKTDWLSFIGGAGGTLEYLGIRKDAV